MARREAKGRRPRREKRNVPHARVYVYATFNNTIITFTDPAGEVILWGSAGTAGFKGSRKSTPYAAQMAAQVTAKGAMDQGVREIDVYVKGPGPGREAAIRSLQSSGLKVRMISDVTPMPHDGCRPPKKRRV